MAASRLGLQARPCLLAVVLLLLSSSSSLGQIQVPWINVDTSTVPQFYVQRALNFLNDITPNGHTYRHGSLVFAQIMVSPSSHQMYRLTFNLEPVCKANGEPCPRETCALDAYVTDSSYYQAPVISKDSVHCYNLPPKKQESGSNAEQSAADVQSIEKQIVNQQSPSLDREVQMSADHNDRPFVAVKATQSEYCPGCPYELNPSLPGLSAFGEQVLRSMDEAGVSDFKHKLVSIVRVTRAVPPSSNVIQYQLYMEIGESTCLRTSLIEVSECPLQSNLPIKLCVVTFEERPWQTGSRRITRNNCTDSLLNNDNEVSASVDPTSGANLQSQPQSPQREDDATRAAEFYDQIAQEAQEVFRMPNMMEVSTEESEGSVVVASELPHVKVALDKTSDESQAKLEDKMKQFDKYLDDFDLPIRTETTSPKIPAGEPVKEEPIVKEHVEEKSEELQKSQSPVLPTVESRRSKRAAPAKGFETNKAGVRKLAMKALEMIDALDEDNKKKHLAEVIEVEQERQYHHMLYHLSLRVTPTDCREAEESTECLDEVVPGPAEICKCDVLTAEKKPLLAPKLLHYSCRTEEKSSFESRPRRASDSKDTILGAPEPIDKDDAEVKRFVGLGLRMYSEGLQGTKQPLVHQVKEVTRQVVAGYKYRIKVDFGVSKCEKATYVAESCELDKEQGLKECVIEAWFQPWLKDKEPEVNVKCGEAKRRRRSLRGENYSAKMLEQSRQLKEERLFREFVSKYKRQYASAEEREERFKIFKENLDMIEELQRNEQGTGRYGVTQFADLTKAEFKARYLGLRPSLRSDNDIPMPMAEIPDVELPAEYDWRHYNVVTPVKNQGQCGSCWAFSVTGNVEGQYAIKHGQLVSLSEQELVDCDKLDDGCNGGLMDQAYRAIEELGGLETETDYPYEAENEKCHFNRTMARVKVASGLNITSNETQMAQWLVKNGPMSIALNANAMQFYIGGVSHPFHFLCSPDDLDHGVLIVGYGVKSYPLFKKTLPYWLIKNSWGPRWGEQGYYRVYRGDGTCGVNKMVTSAVVA